MSRAAPEPAKCLAYAGVARQGCHGPRLTVPRDAGVDQAGIGSLEVLQAPQGSVLQKIEEFLQTLWSQGTTPRHRVHTTGEQRF